MLAVASDRFPPDEGAWAFEMKWDGMRVLATAEGGGVQLVSRLGNDATARFPELAGLSDALGPVGAVLDGEIVVLDDDGRPSFERLQPRMQAGTAHAIARLAPTAPAVLMVFDVLWLDGNLVVDLPYRDRRGVLERLALAGPAWQTPPFTVGDGASALAAAETLGFEGVVMKRLDSPYLPGRRSDAWRKRKLARRQELVVGGWLGGQAGLTGRLGSLLVGYYDQNDFHYAGRVGSGIDATTRTRLESQLGPLRCQNTPFTDAPALPDPHWVTPRVVVEVAFHEWTTAGILRAPRYKGLRVDKDARDVVREVTPGND